VGSEQGPADSAGVSFAAVFDLISSEYGWTDEQILELTLRRMRMAVDAIDVRLAAEREFRVTIAEAITISIIGAMPALAQSKKAGNALAKMAKKISFMAREKDEPEPPSTAMIESMFRVR